MVTFFLASIPFSFLCSILEAVLLSITPSYIAIHQLGLEIVDESDPEEDMQALARKNWEVRARRMGLIPAEGAPQVKRGT